MTEDQSAAPRAKRFKRVMLDMVEPATLLREWMPPAPPRTRAQNVRDWLNVWRWRIHDAWLVIKGDASIE